MEIDEIHEFCLNLPNVEEDLPFDEVTLTFKIYGEKIFAILPLDTPDRLNLKCDPEKAIDLRERYDAISPGFHMNKKHWNTVYINKDLPSEKLKSLIEHSYNLVLDKIPKYIRNGNKSR